MSTLNREIWLFYGFTPNYGNGEHYFFATTLEYITYLETLGVRKRVITNDNYRMENSETLSVNIQTGIPFDDATYVCEVTYSLPEVGQTRNYSLFKAYHVRRAYERGGYRFFTLQIDLWGTYLGSCTISKIHVTRCNRNIGNGLYDEIEATKETSENNLWPYKPLGGVPMGTFTKERYLKDSDVAIVFVANVVIEQNIAGTEVTTATFLFGLTLDEIRKHYFTGTGATYSPVEIAVRFISGITGVTASYWKNNDVEITKAYLLPYSMVSFNENWGLEFISKNPLTPSGVTDKIAFHYVNPLWFRMALDVGDLDINYKYYAGVKDDGVPLERLTNKNNVWLHVSQNMDGLKVIVREGDREKDITQAFEVDLMGNARTQDALQKIAFASKWANNMISDVKGIVKGSNGSAALAGLGVVQMTLKYASMLGERANATGTHGINDGYLTYDAGLLHDASDYYVRYPFNLTMYESAVNENDRAAETGARFDVWLTDFEDIFASNYLEPLISNYTYVEADCDVENVPVEACDAIAERIKSGVRLVEI